MLVSWKLVTLVGSPKKIICAPIYGTWYYMIAELRREMIGDKSWEPGYLDMFPLQTYLGSCWRSIICMVTGNKLFPGSTSVNKIGESLDAYLTTEACWWMRPIIPFAAKGVEPAMFWAWRLYLSSWGCGSMKKNIWMDLIRCRLPARFLHRVFQACVDRGVYIIDHTMWGPPVISWFISPSIYSYKYHKP